MNEWDGVAAHLPPQRARFTYLGVVYRWLPCSDCGKPLVFNDLSGELDPVLTFKARGETLPAGTYAERTDKGRFFIVVWVTKKQDPHFMENCRFAVN